MRAGQRLADGGELGVQTVLEGTVAHVLLNYSNELLSSVSRASGVVKGLLRARSARGALCIVRASVTGRSRRLCGREKRVSSRRSALSRCSPKQFAIDALPNGIAHRAVDGELLILGTHG